MQQRLHRLWVLVLSYQEMYSWCGLESGQTRYSSPHRAQKLKLTEHNLSRKRIWRGADHVKVSPKSAVFCLQHFFKKEAMEPFWLETRSFEWVEGSSLLWMCGSWMARCLQVHIFWSCAQEGLSLQIQEAAYLSLERAQRSSVKTALFLIQLSRITMPSIRLLITNGFQFMESTTESLTANSSTKVSFFFPHFDGCFNPFHGNVYMWLCCFADHLGTTLVVWKRNPGDPYGDADYHIISHNYFYKRVDFTGMNGQEAIRIGIIASLLYLSSEKIQKGTSTTKTDSYTVVEYNTFEEQNGEAELISVKSDHNVCRFNTVIRSTGGITFRHSDYSEAYGNIFIQSGVRFTAGIRIAWGTGTMQGPVCPSVDFVLKGTECTTIILKELILVPVQSEQLLCWWMENSILQAPSSRLLQLLSVDTVRSQWIQASHQRYHCIQHNERLQSPHCDRIIGWTCSSSGLSHRYLSLLCSHKRHLLSVTFAANNIMYTSLSSGTIVNYITTPINLMWQQVKLSFDVLCSS